MLSRRQAYVAAAPSLLKAARCVWTVQCKAIRQGHRPCGRLRAANTAAQAG